MPDLRRRLPSLLPIVFALACGCSGEAGTSGPSLALEPVAFGGAHERLLESALGELQAYRLRYTGPRKMCAVVAEVLQNGKVVAERSVFASEIVPDAGMLLGLIAAKPRRDGEATGLTCVLEVGGSTVRGSADLPEWDAAAAPKEGTGVRAWRRSRSIALRDDAPVVLWRWLRGERVPVENPLTDPPPADVHSVLQVSLRIR